MESLATQLLDGLRRGRSVAEALARSGDPEPGTAAECFAQAARHPDLAGSCERWVPALLVSARPGFGARRLTELADLAREQGEPLDLTRTPLLAAVLGSSNFLGRLLLRHPGWVAALEGALPAAPDARPPEPEWGAIRRAKYQGLMRIAARDLGGRPFAHSLSELSDLADACLVAALACVTAESRTEAPALFALGKLGGRELNFSSDVDLLFVYQPPGGSDPAEYKQRVARLISAFKQHLEAPTDDGFGYRVDLDLRPEGRSGVLANPVDAALAYYETFGQEWERQMLLRLRPLTGPASTLSSFADGIQPFVYRRLIDPSVMHNVRDMKARIEAERRRGGRNIETDLKNGPGGIRDVEFLVQSLQLFFGGREPALRTGNVCEALRGLGDRGLLPAAVSAALTNAYLWLRRAEHALQLPEERQTAAFPAERSAQAALARRMGYDEPLGEAARTHLLEDHTSVRNEVRGHFEALVLGDRT